MGRSKKGNIQITLTINPAARKFLAEYAAIRGVEQGKVLEWGLAKLMQDTSQIKYLEQFSTRVSEEDDKALIAFLTASNLSY